MARIEGVETGRRMARGLCPSCGMRFKVGEPTVHDFWPAQLSLNPRQIDLLLIAAAEFKELCDEAGEYDDAISFLDWVRPDALSRSFDTATQSSKKVAVSAAGRRGA